MDEIKGRRAKPPRMESLVDRAGTTAVPLHHQIYLTLKNELVAGHYTRDDPFPDEKMLARRFGVARMTLRRALQALQSEGLIIRKPGVGTFPLVLDGSVDFKNSIDAFHAALNSRRCDYVEQVYSSRVQATPTFLRHPAADFGDRCLRVSKLYRNDRGPVHFGTHYIPDPIAKSLGDRNLLRKLDLRLLELQKIVSTRTDLIISAVAADIETSKPLEVQVGAPLIRSRRYSFDRRGRPIEYMEGLSRPDLYQYALRFTAEDPNRLAF
jgi:GntR family transcriptional regulator